MIAGFVAVTEESSDVLTFYRVARTDPPALVDFMSADALGRELSNPTPERRRLWRGLSVYDTEERARKKAVRVPLLGRYIAKVEIRDLGAFAFERTTTSSGHYTLWGEADELLRCVVSVAPVERAEDTNGLRTLGYRIREPDR